MTITLHSATLQLPGQHVKVPAKLHACMYCLIYHSLPSIAPGYATEQLMLASPPSPP